LALYNFAKEGDCEHSADSSNSSSSRGRGREAQRILRKKEQNMRCIWRMHEGMDKVLVAYHGEVERSFGWQTVTATVCQCVE
jgi:hypothetical protein